MSRGDLGPFAPSPGPDFWVSNANQGTYLYIQSLVQKKRLKYLPDWAYLPNSQRPQVTATDSYGEPVKITMQRHGDTVCLKFPNNPSGVTIKIQ